MVAMPRRMAAIGERRRDLLAAPADGAVVGLVGPGQHLDQGGLARAVLAEQTVHLAGLDVEVDAVEGPHAGERLGDAGHGEQRWFGAMAVPLGGRAGRFQGGVRGMGAVLM